MSRGRFIHRGVYEFPILLPPVTIFDEANLKVKASEYIESALAWKNEPSVPTPFYRASRWGVNNNNVGLKMKLTIRQ